MKSRTIPVTLSMLLIASAVQAQQPTTPPDTAVSAVKAPVQPNELGCMVLTGRVTDPFAYPLTGATIMLRTPGKGFIPDAFSTNAEGHYIIASKQAIERNTVLEITAPGYATLALTLINCQPLDITLTPLAGPHYKANGRGKKQRPSGRLR
jgi:hypothetical protein